MKKILLLSAVILALSALGSCEIETSSKGDLYGFWHLVGIDTIGRDGTTVDLSDQKIFWAVQVQLIELMDQNKERSPIVCRFEREGDSLFFDTPYYLDRGRGDPLMESVDEMTFYGLNSLRPRLWIEQVSSNKMQLKTNEVILRFRKM